VRERLTNPGWGWGESDAEPGGVVRGQGGGGSSAAHRLEASRLTCRQRAVLARGRGLGQLRGASRPHWASLGGHVRSHYGAPTTALPLRRSHYGAPTTALPLRRPAARAQGESGAERPGRVPHCHDDMTFRSAWPPARAPRCMPALLARSQVLRRRPPRTGARISERQCRYEQPCADPPDFIDISSKLDNSPARRQLDPLSAPPPPQRTPCPPRTGRYAERTPRRW
jgi:hypothetical protein